MIQKIEMVKICLLQLCCGFVLIAEDRIVKIQFALLSFNNCNCSETSSLTQRADVHGLAHQMTESPDYHQYQIPKLNIKPEK